MTRPFTILEQAVAKLIKDRYKYLTVLEEERWKQRAKIRWELEGDRGTKYFHAIALATKKTNMIQAVEHQGVICSDQKGKVDSFFQFFTALMGKTSASMPTVHCDNLYNQTRDLSHIQGAITIEEIKRVIKEWPNNKSPDQDGFTGEFFKAFTDILVPDIHAVFQTVMDQQISLHPLNSSYIALIPKIDHPTKPNEYRPISLIHAIQRLFSKILANRIKGEMQYLVDTAQTGFVKDRQITKGFLYAQ